MSSRVSRRRPRMRSSMRFEVAMLGGWAACFRLFVQRLVRFESRWERAREHFRHALYFDTTLMFGILQDAARGEEGSARRISCTIQPSQRSTVNSRGLVCSHWFPGDLSPVPIPIPGDRSFLLSSSAGTGNSSRIVRTARWRRVSRDLLDLKLIGLRYL
jgi:hypothetical protein